MSTLTISARLPVFPWDRLEPYKATAAAHPDGLVDLSVGTPVDPVPDVVRQALAAASDSPGYPLTYGTAALREAAAHYLRTWHGVAGADPAHVLPLIGSKELVGWLPTLLDLREGDQVGYPELAYPTYEIGARIARAEPVAYADPVADLDPDRTRLLWLNSPANPTGRVLAAGELRRIVDWARRARHPRRVRRVLHRTRLGGHRAGLRAAPGRLRRQPRRASSPSTRCPSGPTSRATAAPSWPATRPSSPSSSPCASTRA